MKDNVAAGFEDRRLEEQWKVPLFYPFVPRGAVEAVSRTLQTRWIGQGPQVDHFEAEFSRKIAGGLPVVAVGAGTHALHLAYRLAGVSSGDEVIVPVFSCVATSIPVLYQGARVRFADIDSRSMNIDPDSVAALINEKTKAIVCTHYGGLPCEMEALRMLADRHGLTLIADAAHAVGAQYDDKPISLAADYTCFSFQAVKHITTGDGGALVLSEVSRLEEARRIRWFGIDRSAKLDDSWNNEINEVGYKYQMTDLSAALGIAALGEFEEMFAKRRKLFWAYQELLAGGAGLSIVGQESPGVRHAAWLFTVKVERREQLEAKLKENGIECGQCHYRNDRYRIFGESSDCCPNMDGVENQYLLLPLHPRMRVEDVETICRLILSGW